MTTTDTAYNAALAYAADLGREHGTNAGAWYFDIGRITDLGVFARTLQGIEDGDPAVLDTLPHADLSGEWSDSLTGPSLAADAVLAAGVDIAQDLARRGQTAPQLANRAAPLTLYSRLVAHAAREV